MSWQARNMDSKPHTVGGATLPPCGGGHVGPWVDLPDGLDVGALQVGALARAGILEFREVATAAPVLELTPSPPVEIEIDWTAQKVEPTEAGGATFDDVTVSESPSPTTRAARRRAKRGSP